MEHSGDLNMQTPSAQPPISGGHAWPQVFPQVAVPTRSVEGSKRILVGEDDELIVMLIQAVLEVQGCTVVGAADGEEFVSKYRREGPFDLVILDLHMPKLDGRQALEQIRALNPGAIALALSGLPVEREGLVPDRAGGFDGRLNKPFDNDVLSKLVRQMLDLKATA
jgi:CheY-like chemotaxis protein